MAISQKQDWRYILELILTNHTETHTLFHCSREPLKDLKQQMALSDLHFKKNLFDCCGKLIGLYVVKIGGKYNT